jgi:hypothetical protein
MKMLKINYIYVNYFAAHNYCLLVQALSLFVPTAAISKNFIPFLFMLLGINWRIILHLIRKKLDGRVWTGFIWLRRGTSGG